MWELIIGLLLLFGMIGFFARLDSQDDDGGDNMDQ